MKMVFTGSGWFAWDELNNALGLGLSWRISTRVTDRQADTQTDRKNKHADADENGIKSRGGSFNANDANDKTSICLVSRCPLKRLANYDSKCRLKLVASGNRKRRWEITIIYKILPKVVCIIRKYRKTMCEANHIKLKVRNNLWKNFTLSSWDSNFTHSL